MRDAARKRVEKAERLLAQNDLLEAKRNLEKAVEYDPKSADAHSKLAVIAEKEGDLARAVEHYRAAFKLNPDSYEAAFAFAECEYRLAQTSLDRRRLLYAAARTYRHAQSLDPTNPAPTLRLAACYREQGELDLAIDTLKETARLNPSLDGIQRELASLFAMQEKYDEAANYYRDVLKTNPDDIATLNGLASVEMAQLSKQGGRSAALARTHAIEHYRRSLRLDPNQPEIEAQLRRLTPYEWHTVKIREADAD